MKKFVSGLLCFSLVLSLAACGQKTTDPADMIAGSGQIVLSSSSSEEDPYEPEFPPAQGEESSSQEAAPSSSAAPSSVAASSSSSQPAASSQSAQAPSSQAPASSSQPVEEEPASKPASKPAGAVPAPDEVRAVWISYLDLLPMLKGQGESAFTANITSAFKKSKNMGLNTVIVQVRPFGDALYSSQYFPWSYLCTGTEGEDPGFDPLAVMVKAAHGQGLRLEAWINPYRIRTSGGTKANPLAADNPAQAFLDEGSDAVIQFDGGISYNPGSAQARKLIVNGVKEIVSNYGVDGIHFDDYFYPTTKASFDADTYDASGTGLSLADWRRENVNSLVKDVYSAIKSIDSAVEFGISPQGNNAINYDSQYIDVVKWTSNKGFIDYICPQIYFGFDNDTRPFSQTLEQWNEMISSSSVELRVGIAAYKVGTTDQYAGGGQAEWVDSTDILARMVDESRGQGHYGGFALYRYDSLFTSPSSQMKEELSNLESIL